MFLTIKNNPFSSSSEGKHVLEVSREWPDCYNRKAYLAQITTLYVRGNQKSISECTTHPNTLWGGGLQEQKTTSGYIPVGQEEESEITVCIALRSLFAVVFSDLFSYCVLHLQTIESFSFFHECSMKSWNVLYQWAYMLILLHNNVQKVMHNKILKQIMFDFKT